ncbi:lytic transglycosylase domain-containing protein [Prosthecomicrobium sp. N25]|uniref:lytic transglycosylase domain-containing protein n=1 Tax=Prosthecomicrobium sp. N25 TaxID=3129254 RepID=UPI0030781C51
MALTILAKGETVLHGFSRLVFGAPRSASPVAAAVLFGSMIATAPAANGQTDEVPVVRFEQISLREEPAGGLGGVDPLFLPPEAMIPGSVLPAPEAAGAESSGAAVPPAEPERTCRAEEGEETADLITLPTRFQPNPGRQAVTRILQRVAAETGVDAVYLVALADKESSLDPTIRARTSSAEGLFQFIDQTWLDSVRRDGPAYGLAAEAALVERDGDRWTVKDPAARERVLGLRRDPYVSGLLAAALLKRDRAALEAELGRPLETREFYFSHLLGSAGAERLLKLKADKPTMAANARFPAAARANRSLFYARQGRKFRALTTAEVYGRLVAMMESRLARYADLLKTEAQVAFGAPGRRIPAGSASR